MVINTQATRDRVRNRYGSVAECVRQYGVSDRVFYMTTSGARGGSGRAGVSRRVLDRLRAEGLLVVLDQ